MKFKDEQGRWNLITIGITGALAIFTLSVVIALWPLRTVPTGHRGVITVGGAIKSIEGEGFTLIAPWQVLSIFNIRAEQADIDKADAATSDTQPVHASMTVRYNIQLDKVSEVFEKYSRDGNLSSYIATATADALKAVTARYTAPDLIAKRAQVSAAIKSELQGKMTQYGANIISIDMRNFEFGKAYMDAINAKTTQDQLLQAAEKRALTVAAEQKSKVAIAEGEATALRAKADGEAYANLKVAQAQAEALRVQNAALSQNKDVLELRRIEVEMVKAGKWNGALPQAIYAGAPIPFLQVGK